MSRIIDTESKAEQELAKKYGTLTEQIREMRRIEQEQARQKALEEYQRRREIRVAERKAYFRDVRARGGIPGPSQIPQPGTPTAIGLEAFEPVSLSLQEALIAWEKPFIGVETKIFRTREKLRTESVEAKQAGKDVEAGIKKIESLAVSSIGSLFRGVTQYVRPYTLLTGTSQLINVIFDPETRKETIEYVKERPIEVGLDIIIQAGVAPRVAGKAVDLSGYLWGKAKGAPGYIAGKIPGVRDIYYSYKAGVLDDFLGVEDTTFQKFDPFIDKPSPRPEFDVESSIYLKDPFIDKPTEPTEFKGPHELEFGKFEASKSDISAAPKYGEMPEFKVGEKAIILSKSDISAAPKYGEMPEFQVGGWRRYLDIPGDPTDIGQDIAYIKGRLSGLRQFFGMRSVEETPSLYGVTSKELGDYMGLGGVPMDLDVTDLIKFKPDMTPGARLPTLVLPIIPGLGEKGIDISDTRLDPGITGELGKLRLGEKTIAIEDELQKFWEKPLRIPKYYEKPIPDIPDPFKETPEPPRPLLWTPQFPIYRRIPKEEPVEEIIPIIDFPDIPEMDDPVFEEPFARRPPLDDFDIMSPRGFKLRMFGERRIRPIRDPEELLRSLIK